MKKGIYSIIATFFFVIVVLISVTGIVLFTNTQSIVETGTQNTAQKHSLARNFRQQLFHCFGPNLYEENIENETCIQSTAEQTILFKIIDPDIKGYAIEKPALGGCEAKTWQRPPLGEIQGEYNDIIVYDIPLLADKSRICHAKLRIYI